MFFYLHEEIVFYLAKSSFWHVCLILKLSNTDVDLRVYRDDIIITDCEYTI